jgi:hypothetical protein
MYSKLFLPSRGSRDGIRHISTRNVAKGNEVTFRFAGREPFRWKITELSPTSGVRWDCIEGPGAAAGTTATFRLFDSADGRKIVECDHEDWSDSDDAFATCNTFWGILMGHLRDYVETGTPFPTFRWGDPRSHAEGTRTHQRIDSTLSPPDPNCAARAQNLRSKTCIKVH